MPEPATKEVPEKILRLVCAGAVDVPGGCDASLEVPFWVVANEEAMTEALDRMGWFLSVNTPPGQGPKVPIVMSLICPQCARALHPPELLREMKRIRFDRKAARKSQESSS